MTRCKICKTEFQRRSMTQKCCSPGCAEIYGREQARKEAAKKARAETKMRKEKSKSIADFKDEAQRQINLYVKWRDWGKPCISCDKPHKFDDIRHASHFKSRGSNSSLMFNLWNVNMSCHSCNWKKGGNIAEYLPRLREKIGVDKVEYLLNAPRSRKFDKEYLLRLKAIFAKKAARQKKKLLLSTN